MVTALAFVDVSKDCLTLFCFDVALESLPEGTDLTPLRERIKPIISRVGGILRVEGQRRD